MNQKEKRIFQIRFHKFQQSREIYFAPQINKALRQQYTSFTSHLKSEGLEGALHKISPEGISGIIKPLYIDAGTVYGNMIRLDLKREKARMPIGFSEQMHQLITNYFGTDILNTSAGITETTKELIRKVFTDAYAAGKGIDDIVKMLENTELSAVRARLIARTETVTSSNKGAMFVAKETGLLMNKEWLATIDGRTRIDHAEVNGQLVPFAEYFTVGGFKMMQPGDRGGHDGQLDVPPEEVCNCRCCVLPIPVRENGRLVRV